MSNHAYFGLKASRLEAGVLFLSDRDAYQTIALYKLAGSPNGKSTEGALVWLSAGFDNVGAHLRAIVAPCGTVLINGEVT